MLTRRGFIAGLGAVVGGVALDKAVPFGRVWSFPKEVKCLNVEPADFVSTSKLFTHYYDRISLDRLENIFRFVSGRTQLKFG